MAKKQLKSRHIEELILTYWQVKTGNTGDLSFVGQAVVLDAIKDKLAGQDADNLNAMCAINNVKHLEPFAMLNKPKAI